MLTEHIRRNAVDGLVHRLSPAVAEIVRQDLIQSVGNALRMQQRQAKVSLHAIANMLRHQVEIKVESEKLDEFIQKQIHGNGNEEWGAW